MKFNIAHLSDLHLGYSSGRKRISELGYNVRENDGYVAFNRVIDQILEDGEIDIVIVAGDMFHSPRPKNHTIIEAQNGLRRIAEKGIKIYILAGNHDATDIRAEIPSSQLLNEPGSGIYAYSDPYVLREVSPGIFVHFLSHHAYVEQGETMEGIKLQENAVNILASHGSCYDTNIGEILRTPNEPREVIIPQYIMDLPWDYTFLGHIHERGWVASTDKGKTDTNNRKQFYNGSLLRRGFSDKYSINGRGWTKWTVETKDGETTITPKMYTIPERDQLDMEAIDVKNKKPREIEKEILDQLKAIDKHIIKKYGEFNLENAPIVRQTVSGINAITRLSLDLQKFNEYTEKYLTHNFKIVPDLTKIETENTTSADDLNGGSDIVAIFKKWNASNAKAFGFEDKIIDDVNSKALEQLKVSRDDLLTAD